MRNTSRLGPLIALASSLALLASFICGNACVAFGAADTLWDYQAVDGSGYGIHPKVWADETDPDSRIVVEGVALAGYNEILDPATQYTAFIQDDTSDRGGIQAWTGKFFYGDALWNLLRTTDYIDFAAGDRLRLTGLIADMGRGKVVMNNRGHSGAPNLVWHVEIIGHPGLPDPQLIDSVSACNYFDSARAGGGELYQTRLVMLHGVQITNGEWGVNKLLTIGDTTGQIGMLLSAMGDFGQHPQPQGRLSVIGIFDQEDDQSPPYSDGYRIWVKRASDISVALDACREVADAPTGERVALVNKIVSRAFPGYFFVQDEGRAGGVKVLSDRAVVPGAIVAVAGMVVEESGGKAIEAEYVSQTALRERPRPMAVQCSTASGEKGLDVSGLLLRLAGTVIEGPGAGQLSLTDGSAVIYLPDAAAFGLTSGAVADLVGVAAKVDGLPALLLAESTDVKVVSP
ncbi:MAG: hypothetical protein IT209_10655 [Armatimonadetes bacterium]|nr:hypothetical protein [Armatimonadota bacterium]